MDAAKVAELKHFVEQCKDEPSILHSSYLGFFKDYLQSLGAQIPSNGKPPENHVVNGNDSEDEIVESDIELDGEVVEPDNDPPQKMGDPNEEVSEDHRDAAQICKTKAMDVLSEGKLEEALEHLTEAIVYNPTSSILLSTRAGVFLKMRKPNAAIRDADAALQINPDSAKGYKTRGIARSMLGQWEAAASDLHIASKLDYDEEISSILKKVEPNVRKIEEHRRKYERLRKERNERKTKCERQRRQAADTEPKLYESEHPAAFQGTVVSIHSSTELETKLKAASNLSQLAILYFTATWCGPCRFMAPVYTDLTKKHQAVAFFKLDIDELSDVAQRWNVNSVPTFFFVKNGREIDKVVGADKNGLESKITLHARKS